MLAFLFEIALQLLVELALLKHPWAWIGFLALILMLALAAYLVRL
jgi:hypothetical protein